jgi:hypothetical protein
MTAVVTDFGPRRTPIRMARSFGIGACLFGAGFLALGILTADDGLFNLVFFGLMGFGAAAFGTFLLVNGSRAAQLHATLTPEALHLVAHRGRQMIFQRGLAEATIPWAEVQGFTSMTTLNIGTTTGTQNTYVLYTSQGDFTFNDIQWDNLEGLLWEVCARTGRTPDEVAPERAPAVAEVQAGKRRVFAFQRIFGWAILILCVPLMLLVILGGIIRGFSADLVSAASFLLLANVLGSAMIRYYRK